MKKENVKENLGKARLSIRQFSLIRLSILNRMSFLAGFAELGSGSHFSGLVLLICVGNLWLLAVAMFQGKDRTDGALRESSSQAKAYSTLALALASFSQVLYLAFALAWLFRWMKFYPGNPVQMVAIVVGLFLSFCSLPLATVSTGVKRVAAIVVSPTTIALWLLLAVLASSVA